jgi:O-antigen ligase
MTEAARGVSTRSSGNPLAGAFVAVVAAVVIGGAAAVSGARFGTIFCAAAVALALGLWLLSSPVPATIALLVAMFLRVALTHEFPADPFLPAFVAVIAATMLWMSRTPDRLRGIGPAEWLMGIYLLWNVYSMVAPHAYAAGDPLTGQPLPVWRFIMTGTLIPFALYVVGRYAFDRERKVVGLLWALLVISAYSATVSIMQFTGPENLVWPRYVMETTHENWAGRAAGVLNQPVANGMILALGVVIAMVLMARRDEPTWRKWVAFSIIVACGIALYLTHTRAAWASGAIALVLGALLAKGYRRGFVAALAIVTTIVIANWSVFISPDRQAGGVGSKGEVEDRLNTLQTALWATAQKPLAGWGIGRFQAVNTYHHQQWSPDIPWERGYAIVSHWNEMGIVAELGLIGLALWLAVLGVILYRLVRAYRVLPDRIVWGRPLALIALIAVAVMLSSGLTVDLRLFDLPTAAVFLLAGVAIGWSDRVELGAETSADESEDTSRALAHSHG